MVSDYICKGWQTPCTVARKSHMLLPAANAANMRACTLKTLHAHIMHCTAPQAYTKSKGDSCFVSRALLLCMYSGCA